MQGDENCDENNSTISGDYRYQINLNCVTSGRPEHDDPPQPKSVDRNFLNHFSDTYESSPHALQLFSTVPVPVILYDTFKAAARDEHASYR